MPENNVIYAAERFAGREGRSSTDSRGDTVFAAGRFNRPHRDTSSSPSSEESLPDRPMQEALAGLRALLAEIRRDMSSIQNARTKGGQK